MKEIGCLKRETLQFGKINKILIRNLDLDNAKLQELNEDLNQALYKIELGIREEIEESKIKFYKADRNCSDLKLVRKGKSFVAL
jgi:hypothetical protein